MKTKNQLKWNKENIKELLVRNDEFVKRSLLKLYEYQTRDEQNSQDTIDHNNVGFNGVDGRFLSSTAEYAKKYNKLSPKQLTHVRKKILKYAQQIANIANHADQANDGTKFGNTAKIQNPQHEIEIGAPYCQCGADTYTCQVCGHLCCAENQPSVWRVDITKNPHAGNVCPTCLKKHNISNN